jgi:hypothetical protein
MKMGNTFVTIESPKFLAAIFRPKICTSNLMTPSKFMYNVFRMNYFPVVSIFRPKDFSAETFIFNEFLLKLGFGRKPENGIVCRKLQILSILLHLWR